LNHLHARFRSSKKLTPRKLELGLKLCRRQVCNADFDPLGIGHLHLKGGSVFLPEKRENELKLSRQHLLRERPPSLWRNRRYMGFRYEAPT